MKVCFICLGNICRSPMAEMMFKQKLREENIKDIFVSSFATSSEEQGNEIYPKAINKLLKENIPLEKHYAKQITKEDYSKYDYFICMDESNIRDLLNIFKLSTSPKIIRLLDLTPLKRDISDPWYTNNFDLTYKDLDYGLDKLLDYLKKNNT